MGRTYLTPRHLFRILHRIADKNIGPVEKAFLAAIKVAAESVQVGKLRSALERGDLREAFEAANINGQLEPQVKRRMESALRTAFLQAASASAAVVVPGMVAAGVLSAEASVRFDLVNQYAVRWAQRRSARLVQQIGDDARANIRSLIARGLSEGVVVRATGRDVAKLLAAAVPRTLGLTTRQYRTWQRVSDALTLRADLQAAVRDGASVEDVAERFGVTPQKVQAALRRPRLDAEQADARAGRLADRMLRRRGLTIARTETITSANAGNRELIRSAVERGLAGVGQMTRFWLVTPDDRLCPICAAIPGMNPDGVGVDGMFVTPNGPVSVAGEVHPQCRCSEQHRVVIEVEELPVAA